MTTPPRPSISVLIPCRNAEPFLAECIRSLEAQTESKYEVLTLDDGSTDGTHQILADWAERDPRVRIFDREGEGIVAALRRLSREARGEHIARMDADDIAAPQRFAAQSRLFDRQPDLAACGTGVRYLPRPEPGSGNLRYETWINGLISPALVARDLFVECPIAHPTLMIRRSVFEGIGGYRETAGPEDYDLVLRLAEAGHALSNVDRPLLDWRLGSHRLSLRSDRYSGAAFRRLKISFLTRDRVPPERPLVIWGAGKVGKAFARAWREIAAHPIEALIDLDPRKIGQVIHEAPVIHPRDLPALTRSTRRPYVLIAVGSPGARDEIREELAAMEFRELDDYRAVA